jgi:hypothetical protein
MDGSRDELLARARLTTQEHGPLSFGDSLDLSDHICKGEARPDEGRVGDSRAVHPHPMNDEQNGHIWE